MTLYERAWQIVASIAAVATRLLPRQMRYPLALRLARATWRALGPLLFKRSYVYPFASLYDETLRAILRTMARQRIPFDPRPRLAVPDDLAEVVREQGAILIGAHFPLNAMATRYLHDLGCRPVVVMLHPGKNSFIWGTREPVESIVPDPTVLIKFRRHIRDRRAIVMVIDREDAGERTEPVETTFGTVHVATPVFEFASRHSIPLYWTCTHSDDAGVPLLHIERIEPRLSAFAALLREHADRVER